MRHRRAHLILLWPVVSSLALWFAAGAHAAPGPARLNAPALTGALVLPQAPPPIAAEQQQAAFAAASSSPEAVLAREDSRTEYENQNPVQVAQTLGTAFPSLISEQEGGPPALAAGQTVTSFKAPNVAVVSLGAGQAGLIDASVPLATETSPGSWQPVDLSLHESGGAFQAKNSALEARLPKSLSEGAQLPSVGVSLTPADEHGKALSDEGQQDGATVLFPNTQQDSDTLLKLTPLGIDLSTTLRSIASPEQFYYKVGMPSGATLTASPTGSQGASVVKEGETLATIRPPQAHDAAGAMVPVSMTTTGDLLTVTVAHNSGEWTYPIIIDPEFDEQWFNPVEGNWEFHEWIGYHITKTNSEVSMNHTGSFVANDYGAWSIHAQGYTKLYEFYAKDTLKGSTSFLSSWFEMFNGGGGENSISLTNPTRNEATLCLNPNTCSPEGVHEGNQVRWEMTTLTSGSEEFGGEITSIAAAIAQEKGKQHSEVWFNTSSSQIDNTENIFQLGYNFHFFGPHNGAFEMGAKDGGMGVMTTRVEFKPNGGSWENYGGKEYKGTASCVGIYCKPEQTETYAYNSLTNGTKHLPDGEGTLRPWAGSVMPYSGSNEYPTEERGVIVDSTTPHGLTLKGLSLVGESYQLGETEAHIKVEATDGEGTTVSSGVASIALAVDGHEIGHPNGSCTLGPCTATGEWSINGAELGVGHHTLTMTATDKAGNISPPTEVQLEVYAANPVAMGPGSVNPESGDFALEAGDVGLSGGTGSLSVSRHYDSRNVTEGQEGPLGPQWVIRLNSVASLEVLPDSSVLTIGPDGFTHFTVKTGGGFEAPKGDTNLTLEYKTEYEGKEPAYLLRDAAQDTATVFRLPSGAKHWMASLSSGPIATDTTTAEYRTVEGSEGKKIVQPTLELAPHPTATCVREKLERGCRGLEFVYQEGETTAKGEAESEWGAYHNRLKEVIAVAYNPTTKAMAKTAVAAYEYDKQGRLRAEWDPRLKPALKTTYGYDAEGHIASLTPPGQETWAFTYGTLATDSTTGRLIKVTRAPASSALWKGLLPSNTEVPKITGSPTVTKRLAVSPGVWSNAPVASSYAWQSCNLEGQECATIAGANNPNFTPTSAQAGRTIRALVTATNGGGSITATTSATAEVEYPYVPNYYSQYGGYGEEGGGKFKAPWEEAVDIHGNVWVLDEGSRHVEEFNSSGSYLKQFKVSGTGEYQYLGLEGLALAPNGDIWIGDRGKKQLDEFTESGTVVREVTKMLSGKYELPFEPSGIATDAQGHIWLYDAENSALAGVVELSETGEALEDFNGTEGHKLGGGGGDVAISGNHVWVSDVQDNKVEEFSTTGTFERELANKFPPGPSEFTLGEAGALAVNSAGSVFVGDFRNHRVAIFGPEGSYEGSFGAGHVTYPNGIGLGPEGDVWVDDTRNEMLTKWTPKQLTEGETRGPEPGATVEYQVPLSGGVGLPNMTSTEAARWGQTDMPTEGTAIFPATKPTGWPATEYTGATTLYMDSQARTVNESNPLGGVSTREYGSTGEVSRTLSADNRATALKEPNTVEAAEHLATTNAYNSSGALTDTWGPLHTVRLAHGKKENEEVQARNHIHYAYDEGAPEGEPYELVTKTVDGAETPAKEEFDQRTTATAYGGQSNLGWKLRKPTSITVEPGGLKLTSTTIYNPTTGNVVETQRPAGVGGDTQLPMVPMQDFGRYGHGKGEMAGPAGNAFDASGNLWIADASNYDVQKYSSSGTFLAEYGKKGSSESEVQFESPTGLAINKTTGNLYVADENLSRIAELNSSGKLVRVFGKEGEAAGQLKTPQGVAIDSHGDVWVADWGNNRVSEFSETGKFIEAIGWGVINYESKFQTCTTSCRSGRYGSELGEFKSPAYIAFAKERMYVSDGPNGRVDVFTESGTPISSFGSPGSGPGQLSYPTGIALDSSGNVYVGDNGNKRIDEFSNEGKAFIRSLGAAGSGPGELAGPQGVAIASSGAMYVDDDVDHRVGVWLPPVAGHAGAHTLKTIYYTPEAEAEVAECRNHKEWAGLPCQTKPAEQSGVSGPPELPVTETKYNMWDQAETVTEKIGTITRTVHNTFDAADRPETTEQTAGEGAAVPKLTDKYNTENGTVEEQIATSSEGTKTVKITHNTRGQLKKYTDADNNTAEDGYDPYSRLSSVTDGAESGKTKRTLKYNEATGEVESLTDSGAGKFGVTYTVGGRLATVTYPNGMTAFDTYNPAGAATGLEYKKTTYCTEEKGNCIWYKDAYVPSIHGEALEEASTNSELPQLEFDNAGRLTKVEESPAGEGCQTRLYSYEEDSNRVEQTERPPTSEGKCASEGGTSQGHSYDTGDRSTDSGIAYDKLGNITTLPAADAGGTTLTSEFYADNQVRKQTQNGETLEYKLDPEDRTRETIASGTKAGTTISHYDAPGTTVAWKSTSSGWTRDIVGIAGEVAAIATNSGPAVLQLHDLQGNIVATAALSETETKVLSRIRNTEFGVPTTKEAPPANAWLGAIGASSELSSGTITQDGSTYVPQTGSPLQTQPVEIALPSNIAQPYSDPGPGYTAESDENAGALRVAQYEAARRAQEEAADPGGVSPAPGCNEEVEGCGVDPERGKNPWQCKVWVSWYHGLHLNNWLGIVGHWHCNLAPPDIEVRTWLDHVVNGKEIGVEEYRQHWYYPGYLGPVGSVSEHGEACEEGWEYSAWAWARTWNPWNNEVNWESWEKDGHTEKCPTAVEDPTGGPGQGEGPKGGTPIGGE